MDEAMDQRLTRLRAHLQPLIDAGVVLSWSHSGHEWDRVVIVDANADIYDAAATAHEAMVALGYRRLNAAPRGPFHGGGQTWWTSYYTDDAPAGGIVVD